MAIVVADTSPLHYLILIGRVSILPKLYREIIVPPAVLLELGHPSAPSEISAWVKAPPAWLAVRMPKAIPSHFETLDFGEQQALALAYEIHADLVLLDDKVARQFAEQESMKAKGTLGVVADAAKAGLLNFRETVETLQRTTMHLEPQFAKRIIEEYERAKEKKQASNRLRRAPYLHLC
jgi:predicted nucleic acid-binding protein